MGRRRRKSGSLVEGEVGGVPDKEEKEGVEKDDRAGFA